MPNRLVWKYTDISYKTVHNIRSHSVELWIQLRTHSLSGTLRHTFNTDFNKGQATQQHEH